MNCFYHSDRNAVGMCKCCNKGLCPDCAADLGEGLACKGVHEEQVKSINFIIEKNAKIYRNAPVNTALVPLFYFFIGLVFFIFGFILESRITNFLIIMGVGFILFAIVVFFRNRALFARK